MICEAIGSQMRHFSGGLKSDLRPSGNKSLLLGVVILISFSNAHNAWAQVASISISLALSLSLTY